MSIKYRKQLQKLKGSFDDVDCTRRRETKERDYYSPTEKEGEYIDLIKS